MNDEANTCHCMNCGWIGERSETSGGKEGLARCPGCNCATLVSGSGLGDVEESGE